MYQNINIHKHIVVPLPLVVPHPCQRARLHEVTTNPKRVALLPQLLPLATVMFKASSVATRQDLTENGRMWGRDTSRRL